MVFFGHLGLTTGAVKIYEKLGDKKDSVDYRVVLAAAILPDIIDKPIGVIFFRNTFHNSRLFAHTLIFSLVLLIIGLSRIKKGKKISVFIGGLCCLTHLFLDSMWNYAGILFWPFLGLKFPTRPEGDWAMDTWHNLITNPYTYVPEIIGFLIIMYFFIRLIKNKKLKKFIFKGQM